MVKISINDTYRLVNMKDYYLVTEILTLLPVKRKEKDIIVTTERYILSLLM